MLTLHSFLQSICQWLKAWVVPVTKKIYRHAAVITTGTVVVAVVTLNSSGFGGGGKNALMVYAETMPEQEELLEEEETEELERITEAKVQAELTNWKNGEPIVKEWVNQAVQGVEERFEETKENFLKGSMLLGNKMEQETKKQPETVIPYTEEDYQVLLKIVQAEAGICDEQGKILVANVIINRVKDEDFPNTIKQVVYQRSQFSPVSNGRINSVKVTEETVECVNRALQGEDYSQGALYFMYRGASRRSAVSWFDSRLTYLFQHGQHEFFK
ncbi:MAG: cell wall hydrolase [Lachnospiraceae bacterium]